MWPFSKALRKDLEKYASGGIVEQDLVKMAIDYIHAETVDCETCGCMVNKSIAVKGKSEIRNCAPLIITLDGHDYAGSYPTVEYIHTPYYCKRCAPKKKAGAK